MDISEQLKTLDLTKSEIVVYLQLLEFGISTPPQIAKITGIARTNCYNILKALKEKVLLRNKRMESEKPILRAIHKRFWTLLIKKASDGTSSPDLRALHVTQKNKPKIRFLKDGGCKGNLANEATRSTEILAIGSTKRLVDLDANFFAQFERTLKERGIILHDILTLSSREVAERTTKPVLMGLYDYVYLPSGAEDMLTDILVWDDSVALMALEAPIFGTVVTSPHIAQSFRVIGKRSFTHCANSRNIVPISTGFESIRPLKTIVAPCGYVLCFCAQARKNLFANTKTRTRMDTHELWKTALGELELRLSPKPISQRGSRTRSFQTSRTTKLQ